MVCAKHHEAGSVGVAVAIQQREDSFLAVQVWKLRCGGGHV